MYAIVSTGGKQYKVAEQDRINVEKLPLDEGGVTVLPVLFLSLDGGDVVIDSDALSKAGVLVKVIEQFRGKKEIVFKFKKRKGYKKTQGHRQYLSRIEVLGIYPDGVPDDAIEQAQVKDEASADDEAKLEKDAPGKPADTDEAADGKGRQAKPDDSVDETSEAAKDEGLDEQASQEAEGDLGDKPDKDSEAADEQEAADEADDGQEEGGFAEDEEPADTTEDEEPADFAEDEESACSAEDDKPDAAEDGSANEER